MAACVQTKHPMTSTVIVKIAVDFMAAGGCGDWSTCRRIVRENRHKFDDQLE